MNPHLERPSAAPAPRIGIYPTARQRANLLAFLDRATMTGKEAAAYLELRALIERAQPVAETKMTPANSSLPAAAAVITTGAMGDTDSFAEHP